MSAARTSSAPEAAEAGDRSRRLLPCLPFSAIQNNDKVGVIFFSRPGRKVHPA
ncbi:MAG: hypothetical protein MZV63_56365 [Marinilabiliales bacterium]|nr:hypothetical protein [Marinilabiliales bacterium]